MIPPELLFYSGCRVAGQDDAKLAARVWQSESPVADVIGLHGIISHSGWYEASGSKLAAGGMNVHLLDRRGSGLNLSSRGDVDDWRTWIDDVLTYLLTLPVDRPKILMGISWGGILATSLVARHPDVFSGLALVCPGLFSRKAANATQRAALRVASSAGIRKHQVTIPLRDPAWFTNSPKWQSHIADDPLTLRKITIDFAINNLSLLNFALGAPERIAVPVLLMLAETDPITDNALTRAFVERMSTSDRTVIEYPGASHTLEFEDDPSDYFDDLTRWCRTRVEEGRP